jgi:hypothetical protein
MMRFAAYYSSTIGRNLNLRPIMSTAIWQDLFRFEPILLVRYRWPQPQASEDGPGPISLVLQKHPIRGVWAEAQVYSA